MKPIVRYLGYLFVVSAIFRVLPIAVGLYYGESVEVLMLNFLVSVFVGLGLMTWSLRMQGSEDLTLPKGLFLVALSFLLLPLMAAFSFMPYLHYNFWDAYFEAVSGFTTTGLSVMTDLENLPRSILLWRAETQWIGGVGIVLFFLFLLTHLGAGEGSGMDSEEKVHSSLVLYKAGGFSERLEGGLRSSVAHAFLIYCGYTVFGVLFLVLAGMSWFKATCLTFTALSTGGFGVGGELYANISQMIVLLGLMLIGSVSFITHNKLLRRDFMGFVKEKEKNVFLLVLVLAVGLAYVNVWDWETAVFGLVSAFTTTGFGDWDFRILPQLFLILVMLGMVWGGCTASTAGGLKTARIYTLFRGVIWQVRKISLPTGAVVPLKVGGKEMESAELLSISIFVFAYAGILVLGTLVFMLFGYDFLDSAFQVFSALGTVGLSTLQIADLNFVLKGVLMLAMLLGRLEIFPLLIVVRRIFQGKLY